MLTSDFCPWSSPRLETFVGNFYSENEEQSLSPEVTNFNFFVIINPNFSSRRVFQTRGTDFKNSIRSLQHFKNRFILFLLHLKVAKRLTQFENTKVIVSGYTDAQKSMIKNELAENGKKIPPTIF